MANELVLIVEDDASSRKLARDLLAVNGYRTIECETGEEGLRLALELYPALILMDIQLPGISGIEALKRLLAGMGSFMACRCRSSNARSTVRREVSA